MSSANRTSTNRTPTNRYFIGDTGVASKIVAVPSDRRDEIVSRYVPEMANWVKEVGFSGKTGEVLPVQTSDGRTLYLCGIGNCTDASGFNILRAGSFSKKLPIADYVIENNDEFPALAAVGFALSQYAPHQDASHQSAPHQDASHQSAPHQDAPHQDAPHQDAPHQDAPHQDASRQGDRNKKSLSRLVVAESEVDRLENEVSAVCYARDLINSPANQMTPAKIASELEAIAADYADRCDADAMKIYRGQELEQNFPLVAAVGRASVNEAMLCDVTIGDKSLPLVTLVGKGVSFDTGGLDIKPANAMRHMKKDMGGAALVLALARAVLELEIPIAIRVIIATAENSISANAFRPGDVITSRSGKSIEIGNTDAEGRLLLADALCLASEVESDLLLDFATLTGAARVALGDLLMPVYSNRSDIAGDLVRSGDATGDPLWHMPLHQDYADRLHSNVADLCNITPDAFAGSITAALFLEKFVKPSQNWAHFDVFCYSATNYLARAAGAEANSLRAVIHYLRERYQPS